MTQYLLSNKITCVIFRDALLANVMLETLEWLKIHYNYTIIEVTTEFSEDTNEWGTSLYYLESLKTID